MRGKEKERESFLSSVSWVERKREVKRRRRGSMVSLKRGGEAMEDRERGWCWENTKTKNKIEAQAPFIVFHEASSKK